MAEVRFDYGDDAERYQHDHYLSVRVGDVQKLAKMSSARAFKFSAAALGSRKYAKVEVYKRVGASTMCIDPVLAAGESEVHVPLDDASTLCMTALVRDTGSREQKGNTNQVEAAPLKPSTYQQEVAAYLDQHQLEVRLADAMQRLLRERPADPASRLAELLQRSGDRAAAGPMHQPTRAPPTAARGAKAPSPEEQEEARGAAGRPTIVRAGCFGGYYREHFRAAGHPEGLYAGFGRAAPAAPAPAAAEEHRGRGSGGESVAAPPAQAREAPPAALAAAGGECSSGSWPSWPPPLPSARRTTTTPRGGQEAAAGEGDAAAGGAAAAATPRPMEAQVEGAVVNLVDKARELARELHHVGATPREDIKPLVKPAETATAVSSLAPEAGTLLPSMGSFQGPIAKFGGLVLS